MYRDLNVIASIKPGMTLSDTTMTVVDHNSWSSSFWRRYSGENRNTTINRIKDLMDEALSMDYSSELDDAIERALVGINNLKETYKDDQEIVLKLDLILSTSENRSRGIKEVKPVPEKPKEVFSPTRVVRKPTDSIHPILTKWSRYQIETIIKDEVTAKSLSIVKVALTDLALTAIIAGIFF